MAIFTFFAPFATSSGASEGPSAVLQVVMGAMLGFGLGVMMGFAQWIVLRQYVLRAGWWILFSALGWAGGMTVIFAGMNVIPDSASTALIVMMSVASAVAMGATFAAITGIGLIWLLRDKLV